MSRTTAQAQASEQKPIKLDFGSFTSSAGRQKNEDRVEVRRGKLQIAMCADGMGGGVLGAAMSDVAVRTVYEFLESQPFSDPPALLEQAFDKANAAMIKLMGASKLAANSGSTLICAVLQRTPGGLIVHMGSVGDTRAYLVGTDGKLSQMNRDHSYYEQLIDQGLTPAEARQDKNARKLTFSLGSDFMIRDVPYFYSKHRIGPGESMLLCTDGVSEFVDPNDIARIIKGQPADKAAQQIVQKAYTNKTTDNASAVVVRYDNTSAFALPMRRAAQIGGALLVVGALAFGISSAIGQEPETIVVDGQTVTITPLPADVTGEPTSTFAAGPGQATSTRIPTATPTPPPTDTPVIIIPTTPPQATPRPGQPTTRPATARPTQPNPPPTQAPNNPNPQPV
ncbi:MAG TPA: protein phosphatase 2C domain-containing protein, partial [Herpetosiphonaceae bacterium]